MEILIGRVIVDIGKAIGKAVLAGVGLELAKVASDHLRKRLGPKDDGEKKKTPEEIEAENAKLREEVERLRSELASKHEAAAPAEAK